MGSTTSEDPARYFDLASFGVVKVLEDERSGSTYRNLPWEPKAEFRALAGYGEARARAH